MTSVAQLYAISIIIILTISGYSQEEEPKRLPPKSINPSLTKDIKKFIPPGFNVLDQEDGDLNKDGIIDKILILKSDLEQGGYDTLRRPVIILLRNKNGELRKAFENNYIVLNGDDGGIHGDPYHGITIKNGFFSIEHFGGSGWRWNYVITFKYDDQIKNWKLHRIGNETWHISKPKEFESHITTSKEFGTVLFNDYVNKLLKKL